MLRHNFTEENENYRGGRHYGYVYHIDFLDVSFDELLKSVRCFLDEEGYSDVPLPKSGKHLLSDYLNPDSFSNGLYVYHPVIISASVYADNAISLYIHNEDFPDHEEMWKSKLSNYE